MLFTWPSPYTSLAQVGFGSRAHGEGLAKFVLFVCLLFDFLKKVNLTSCRIHKYLHCLSRSKDVR